jgi:polyketide cyclase/dehydrase/lipid transport protein
VVEAHRIIRASREHVFAFVAHADHLPRYGGPLWLAADPVHAGGPGLEDRRGGEPLVTLRGYFAGLPVEAVIRASSRAPQSVDVSQVRGTLRGFSQRFTVESGDDGTVLTLRVEADPGIPMVSDEAAKHFLTQYVERMLDRLRLAAERRAPSRRPVRPSVAIDAGGAAPGDAVIPTEAAEPDSSRDEVAAAGGVLEPAAPQEPAVETRPERRPGRRPMPPRGPRPPRSSRGSGGGPQRPPQPGAAASDGVPPAQAGASGSVPADQRPAQGRRRRRRRRGGRGGGAGAGAGGAPSAP